MTIGDYVVLWSPHQNQFHVETINQMLTKNMNIFSRQSLGDYIVLGFEHSHEDASESCRRLRKSISDSASESTAA